MAKNELNSIACDYCGGHGLDKRGNCLGCGAPTSYVVLRNDKQFVQQEFASRYRPITSATSAAGENVIIGWDMVVS